MTVSEIRWREPMYGPDTEQHTFKVGDRVRIARLADQMTTRDIIGHMGVITEIDDFSNSMVEFKCGTCQGIHTMHEQELDYYGDDLVQLVQAKAGIMDEAVEINQAFVNLEDFLAVAMYKAGFERIAVQDKETPHGDPSMPRPVWAKYVYGVIPKLAPLRVYADALIKIAREAGGYLAEWATYSVKSGYSGVITEHDLDTLAMEMPIRAVIVAKSDTFMGDYEEIKDMIAYWLQDKYQIDIGAIYRAVRDLGFKMGNWSHEKSVVYSDQTEYSLSLEWIKEDGTGPTVFKKWADEHWCWIGRFNISIDDPRAGMRYTNVYINRTSEADTLEVNVKEEEDDVPF